MLKKVIKFKATDGIMLDGFLNIGDNKTNKILIQVHGMTSNCFKEREKIIAEKITDINVDTLGFNNRGSEIVKYIRSDTGKFLGGSAYEDVEESYYDIIGAVEYAIENGYEEIYLQGHSLGSTKVLYTYNRMKKEKYKNLEKIKGIILLSLVDIPELIKYGISDDLLCLMEEKEKNGKEMDLVPISNFVCLVSVKTFFRYYKYNENIDFARYGDDNFEYDVLNQIDLPLFMRWGNINELIMQKAEDIVNRLNKKINNSNKDINYIDGADHSYSEKENILAEEIINFLKN